MQSLPVPPPPITPPSEPLRPAGWWYGVSAGVGVLGVVVAGVVGVRGISALSDRVDGFDRALIPGAATVEIEDPGDYTIYHEYPGADDDSERGIIDVAFEATLTDPDGGEVELEPYDAHITYSFGDHQGVAMYSFTAPEAGNYELVTTGGPGNAAVGRGIGRGIVASVLLAVGIGLGTILAAVIMAVVVAIQRGRDRRRRQVLGHTGPWAGPPGAAWQTTSS
jgi:hypothetical protein